MSVTPTTVGDETVASPKTTKGRARSTDARDRVLNTTLARLTSHGFGGLIFEAIAAEARVAKTTIYRWWPDRASLAMDALNLLPPAEDAGTGSLVGDLRLLRAAVVKLVNERNLGEILPALASEIRRAPDQSDEIRAFIAARLTPFLRAVESAIERGELPADTDAALTVAMLNGPLVNSLFFEPEVIDEESYLHSAAIIIAGLRGFAIFNDQTFRKD